MVAGELVGGGEGGDEELDGGFGEEKGVCGENAGDAAVAHTADELETEDPGAAAGADVAGPGVAVGDFGRGVREASEDPGEA